MHYPSNTMDAIWAGATGVGMYANSESLTWLTENMLTYNKQIGYNKLNTTLVYTTQKNEHNVASINAQNYSHDDHLDFISSKKILIRSRSRTKPGIR